MNGSLIKNMSLPDRPLTDTFLCSYCDRHLKKLLHGKVQKKSMMRFMGEHSLQSSAGFAGVQASIGLIVGEDE